MLALLVAAYLLLWLLPRISEKVFNSSYHGAVASTDDIYTNIRLDFLRQDGNAADAMSPLGAQPAWTFESLVAEFIGAIW